MKPMQNTLFQKSEFDYEKLTKQMVFGRNFDQNAKKTSTIIGKALPTEASRSAFARGRQT